MSVRVLGLGMLVVLATAGRSRPPGEAVPYTAFPKLVPPAGAVLPRLPVPELPATPTPLDRVRHAQVHQGNEYLVRLASRVELGQYGVADYEEYCRTAAEVYKVRAELTPAAADKVAAYEARVVAFKALEARTVGWVEGGTQPPHRINLALFARLQAEKELLVLQEELAKGGKR